jgi:hypothetical protein
VGATSHLIRASLIAGSRDHEDVAGADLLQDLPQAGRQQQRVDLLGGADIDDVGAPFERTMDGGGELLLRAGLRRTQRSRGKDRDGDGAASGATRGMMASLEPAMME